jgi:hypothetical protein
VGRFLHFVLVGCGASLLLLLRSGWPGFDAVPDLVVDDDKLGTRRAGICGHVIRARLDPCWATNLSPSMVISFWPKGFN